MSQQGQILGSSQNKNRQSHNPSQIKPQPQMISPAAESDALNPFREGTLSSQAEMLQKLPSAQQETVMQRIAQTQGNRHVQRLVGSMQTPSQDAATTVLRPSLASKPAAASLNRRMSLTVQTKLTVSDPGDLQEIEADQVADQVMRMPASATPPPPPEDGDGDDDAVNRNRPTILNRYLHRSPAQRAGDGIGGNVVNDDVQARIEGMKGGGTPLPESDRAFFEPRMGVDLGSVRLHTDSSAVQTSRDLNARAYIVGPHVAFGANEYQPGTTAGRHLLAHELTHVVQQGGAGTLPRKTLSSTVDKANRCTTDVCRMEEAQLKAGAQRKSNVPVSLAVQRKSDGPAAPTLLGHNKVNRCAGGACGMEIAQLKTDAQVQRTGVAKSVSAEQQKVNRCMTGACRAEEAQLNPNIRRKAAASGQVKAQRKGSFGAVSKIQDAGKQQESIQRWPNWDDIKEGAGNTWDATGGQVVDAAGDLLDDVASWGADQFLDFVRSISPGLADLIQNGPIGMLTESIQTGIQSWLTSILGNVNLGEIITSLISDFTNAITIVQGVLNNDPACCAIFADTIQKLSEFAQGFLDNPVIQSIQSALEQANTTFTDLTTTLLSPVFDVIMESVGDVFSGVQGLADTIWGWGSAVKDALGEAWNWVRDQLGLPSDGLSGVFDWLKSRAIEAWSSLSESLGPVSEPLRAVAGAVALASPVGWALIIVPQIPDFVTAVQWLWDNKDNPNIIEDAHEQMGNTILPQLLEAGQGFSDGLTAGVTQFATEITNLGTAVLSLLGAVSGVPLVSIASGLIQALSEGVQSLVAWVTDTFQTVAEGVQTLFGKIKALIEPYKEILCSIGLAITNPAMIPIMLAGWAWLALPDCVKAPIINFLLDLVIRLLQEAPDLPMFGLLWPVLKSAIIGFLAGVRSQSDEVKVTITNRLAKILSGSSPEFLLGFVKGFLRGLWEGLTDPFVLMYYAVVGLGRVISWFNDMAQQAVDAGQEAEESSVDEEDVQAQLIQQMQATATELEPPVGEVTGGFMPAIQQFFSGGDGITLDELSANLADVWQSLLDGIAGAAGQLAQSIVDFLMQDSADGDMGDFIGWLAGTIVFEIILAILTAGSVNAAKGVMKVIKVFARILDWTGEVLGMAFRALGRLAGFLMDMVRGLGRFLGNVGGAIGRVLGALQEIAEIIMSKIDELLGLAGRLGTKFSGELFERLVKEFGEETAEKLMKELGEELLEELGADLIVKLGPDLLEELGAGLLRSLGPELLEELGAGLLKQLGPELLEELGPALLKTLGPELLEELGPALLKTLGPDLLEKLGPDLLKQLGPDLLMQFGPELLESLGPDLLKQMGPDLLKRIGPDQLRKLGPELAGTLVNLGPEGIETLMKRIDMGEDITLWLDYFRTKSPSEVNDILRNLDRAAEIRRMHSVGKGRNIAFSSYDIGGTSQSELIGLSGPTKVGTADIPLPRIFTPEARREVDSEVKILETIAHQFQDNRSVSGTIDLFTERAPCDSCSTIIAEFREMFPNITINVQNGPKYLK